MKALEKVCTDLVSGAKAKDLKVAGPTRWDSHSRGGRHWVIESDLTDLENTTDVKKPCCHGVWPVPLHLSMYIYIYV